MAPSMEKERKSSRRMRHPRQRNEEPEFRSPSFRREGSEGIAKHLRTSASPGQRRRYDCQIGEDCGPNPEERQAWSRAHNGHQALELDVM
jgi:hypothetical protein